MAILNFTDIPEQKNFDPLPAGLYTAEITSITRRQAGDGARNPGALNLRWEFTIINNDEYDNRKVFDNQTCVPSSLWKVKALLNALDLDTSSLVYDGEEQEFYYTGENGMEILDLEELTGSHLDIKLSIRAAGKDQNTGKDYDAQNRVTGFYVHETSDEELMA